MSGNGHLHLAASNDDFDFEPSRCWAWRSRPKLSDEENPLLLTTERVLFHYHTGIITRRPIGLAAICPEGLSEMHAEDASRYRLLDGATAHVSNRRGEVFIKNNVTDGVEPGIVFMTFHFAESAAKLLTNPVVDPVAKIPDYKVCAAKTATVATEVCEAVDAIGGKPSNEKDSCSSHSMRPIIGRR